MTYNTIGDAVTMQDGAEGFGDARLKKVRRAAAGREAIGRIEWPKRRDEGI